MKQISLLGVALVLSVSVAAQTPASKSRHKPKASADKTSKVRNQSPKAVSKRGHTMPDKTMGPDELAIAERVHMGHLPCELGASVRLEADASQPGYFHVQGKGFRYRMHPVTTTTGAIRLEDTKAGAVWLQLANKSMLMDQNKGRRMADECAHPDQIAFAQEMKTNPPPMLFDTTGMGRSND